MNEFECGLFASMGAGGAVYSWYAAQLPGASSENWYALVASLLLILVAIAPVKNPRF